MIVLGIIYLAGAVFYTYVIMQWSQVGGSWRTKAAELGIAFSLSLTWPVAGVIGIIEEWRNRD